jgi:hypothetical protein
MAKRFVINLFVGGGSLYLSKAGFSKFLTGQMPEVFTAEDWNDKTLWVTEFGECQVLTDEAEATQVAKFFDEKNPQVTYCDGRKGPPEGRVWKTEPAFWLR